MTLSKDIGDLLLQRTLGMPNHTQLKQHDNTAPSIQQINKITQLFPGILLLCYFGEP